MKSAWSNRLYKRRGGNRGALLIEMALLTPLVLLLFLGAIHFGYLFFIYNALEKSVRDGARYAAGRTIITAAGIPSDIQAVVEGAVVYGASTETTAVVPGLTYGSNMVLVERIPAAGRPARVRVSIQNYTYQGVLSFMLGNITLTGKPAVEMPYIGRYAVPPS